MKLASVATERFEGHQFPTTTGELIEDHGDVEISLPNGAVTLGEVLGRLPADERLETREEARLSTYSALSEAAIGRKGYSDRDATCPGEDGHDPQSI